MPSALIYCTGLALRYLIYVALDLKAKWIYDQQGHLALWQKTEKRLP